VNVIHHIGTITDNNCYNNTYSWNTSTNKCVSCIAGSITTNSNFTNTTNKDTTNTYGYLLDAMTLRLLGLMA
jgi:hypothetical protein